MKPGAYACNLTRNEQAQVCRTYAPSDLYCTVTALLVWIDHSTQECLDEMRNDLTLTGLSRLDY